MDGSALYTLGLNTSGFDTPLRGSQGALGSFGSTVGGMPGKLAAMAAGAVSLGAVVVGLRRAFNAAADMETLEASFRTLTGSSAKAEETLNRLKELGASTPFEFPELAEAAKKLIAFGEGADTVDKTLRRLGDVASGVGAPVGEIAEIYGKIRTQGTLYNEDLNQLAGRGIPIIQTLADGLGISAGEVKKLASEGKITFPLLEESFGRLTDEGGQFHGMMQAQSATTNGLLSTLKDGVGDIFRTLGEPLTDAVRPMLTEAIELTGRVGAGLKAGIDIARSAFQQGELGNLVKQSLELAFKQSVNVLYSGLQAASAFFGEVFIATMEAGLELFEKMKDPAFWQGLATFFAGLGNILTGSLELALAPLIAKLTGLTQEQVEARANDKIVRGKSSLEVAKILIDDSGNGLDPVETLKQGVRDGTDAAKESLETSENLFDTDKLAKELASAVSQAAPEGYKGLVEAYRGTKEAAESVTEAKREEKEMSKLLTDSKREEAAGVSRDARNATASVATTGTAQPEERPRRRGVLNAAQSITARFGRLADADKEKFGSLQGFATKSALDRIALRENGGLGAVLNQSLAEPAGRAVSNVENAAKDKAAEILERIDNRLETLGNSFGVA